MLPGLIFIAFLVMLAGYVIYHANLYKRHKLQNNSYARENLGLTIVLGILCIIFLLFLILNREEFFSNNHLKKCSMREENLMQNYSPRAIQDYGSLPTERVFILKSNQS